MSGRCAARRDDGVETTHCLHDCVHDGVASAVCCWCGDLFLSEHAGTEHGEYAPTPAASGIPK